MKKIIKDILFTKEAGEKVGELLKETCPICGSDIYIVDGESFCMCDCDKIRPAEYTNV